MILFSLILTVLALLFAILLTIWAYRTAKKSISPRREDALRIYVHSRAGVTDQSPSRSELDDVGTERAQNLAQPVSSRENPAVAALLGDSDEDFLKAKW